MAVFQYKDLMISVGSNLQGLPGHCFCYALSSRHTYQRPIAADLVRAGAFCRPTAPPCHYGTPIMEPYCRDSYPINPCQMGTCQPTPVQVPYTNPGPEDLAIIKEQLQQALADIEQQERSAAESMEPKTEAEIESLQTKLHEAISELERRKEELRRKSRE